MKTVHLNKNERIIIFTSNMTFVHIYEFLKSRSEIKGVVIPENRLGSEKIMNVQQFCKNQGISIFVHPTNDEEMRALCNKLKKENCTLAISWSYSQIIRKPLLDLFPLGIWNMHGGKIPEYRGANVLQWAIVNGEKELGVTWHLMDEKIDHGLLLKEGKVTINDDDNALTVRDKTSKLGLELFKELWESAQNDGVHPYEVDMQKGHYWKPRNIYDGIISNSMCEQDIRNLLRAQCPPWPEPIYCDKESNVYRINGIAKEPDQENTILFENDKCKLWLYAVLEKDEDVIEKVKQKMKQIGDE